MICWYPLFVLLSHRKQINDLHYTSTIYYSAMMAILIIERFLKDLIERFLSEKVNLLKYFRIFLKLWVFLFYSEAATQRCCKEKLFWKKQLYWNHTLAWVFSCKFAAYFQNTYFPKNTSGWLLLYILQCVC